MRVYVTNGPRNGWDIDRKVGRCPERRRQWVSGNVRASSRALHAADTYRPRFQVRTRPSYKKTPLGVWPLHDIANANIIWCILQYRGVGGNAILRTSVGDGMGGVGCLNKGGACEVYDWFVHKSFDRNEYLVKAISELRAHSRAQWWRHRQWQLRLATHTHTQVQRGERLALAQSSASRSAGCEG